MIPAFALLGVGSFGSAVAGLSLFGFFMGGISTTTSLLVVDLFPANVRYSASSLSYNLSYTAFGGSAPYLATWLVSRTHNNLAPGWYLLLAAAISLITIVLAIRPAPETLQPETDPSCGTRPQQQARFSLIGIRPRQAVSAAAKKPLAVQSWPESRTSNSCSVARRPARNSSSPAAGAGRAVAGDQVDGPVSRRIREAVGGCSRSARLAVRRRIRGTTDQVSGSSRNGTSEWAVSSVTNGPKAKTRSRV